MNALAQTPVMGARAPASRSQSARVAAPARSAVRAAAPLAPLSARGSAAFSGSASVVLARRASPAAARSTIITTALVRPRDRSPLCLARAISEGHDSSGIESVARPLRHAPPWWLSLAPTPPCQPGAVRKLERDVSAAVLGRPACSVRPGEAATREGSDGCGELAFDSAALTVCEPPGPRSGRLAYYFTQSFRWTVRSALCCSPGCESRADKGGGTSPCLPLARSCRPASRLPLAVRTGLLTRPSLPACTRPFHKRGATNHHPEARRARVLRRVPRRRCAQNFPGLPTFGDNKKTVIITGASSGLGKATTEVLANQGWHVVMACRDPAKAKEVRSAADSHVLVLCAAAFPSPSGRHLFEPRRLKRQLHSPQVAAELDLPKGSYSVMCCELDSLKATADFCNKCASLDPPVRSQRI